MAALKLDGALVFDADPSRSPRHSCRGHRIEAVAGRPATSTSTLQQVAVLHGIRAVAALKPLDRFPCPAGRGIEATHRKVRVAIHGIRAVAALKRACRLGAGGSLTLQVVHPRHSCRGRIEARQCRSSDRSERSVYPRHSCRGRIEAQRSRSLATSRGPIHGIRAVAPLKPCAARRGGGGIPSIHGIRAVAPLKHCQWRLFGESKKQVLHGNLAVAALKHALGGNEFLAWSRPSAFSTAFVPWPH